MAVYKPFYPELEVLAIQNLPESGLCNLREVLQEPEKLIWQKIVEDTEWLKEMQKSWWEAYPLKKR